MNIWLETYLNLTHLTILNANFYSYQLNDSNCFFNCLSDITKLFCCHFNTSADKLFLLFLCQIDLLRICPVELFPTKLLHTRDPQHVIKMMSNWSFSSLVLF